MRRKRTLVLLPALVACALAVGCGGGGGDSTGSVQGTGRDQAEANAEIRAHNETVREDYAQRRQAEAPTPDERQAGRSATDFYEVLGADKAKEDPNRTEIDSTSFCELMSEEARAETTHYAEVSSGVEKEWDCESAVELLVLRSKREGGFGEVEQAKVIAVNARGDRATASVRFGDGPVTSVPLVKEEGEWKLAAASLPAAR